jgi:DNA polymerase V
MNSSVVFESLAADSVYLRPLFLCLVQAGAPSHADDEMEGRLDLNHHIFRNPESTMMVWMKGDAFKSEGVFDGDLVIADSSLKPQPTQLVVVLINGQQRIRRLTRLEEKLYLTTDNGPSELIEVEGNSSVQILAVVTFTIHTIPD